MAEVTGSRVCFRGRCLGLSSGSPCSVWHRAQSLEPLENPVDSQARTDGRDIDCNMGWYCNTAAASRSQIQNYLSLSVLTCPGFLGVCTPQLPSGRGGRPVFQAMPCCVPLWRSFLLWPSRQRMPERLWLQPCAGDATVRSGQGRQCSGLS